MNCKLNLQYIHIDDCKSELHNDCMDYYMVMNKYL